VRGLAERVDNCAATGSQTNLGMDTFGILGQPFAMVIGQFWVQEASEALKLAGQRVHKVSEELAANAADLDATEQDIARSFGAI
jgi:hypothetical protein